MNSDNIQIILVEPQVPGNVGAVCRAMINMGFPNLITVNPWHIGHPQARYMAHGAEKVLESARIAHSIQEAVKDSIFVVGTTRRSRRGSHFVDVKVGVKHISSLSEKGPVSILFGREDKGLFNEELILCQMQLTIPTVSEQPSLNLSQAVLIVCHELFSVKGISAADPLELPTHEELEHMYEHIMSVMNKTGFIPLSNKETFQMAIRRVFGRTLIERRDVAVIHKICQHINRVANGISTGSEENKKS